MNTMNEITSLLEKSEALYSQSMAEDLSEEESDRLYAAFWAARGQAAARIVAFTGGSIDRMTAMRMIHHCGGDILNVLHRAVA